MSGEMGLDFDRNFSTPAQHTRAFEAQLKVAAGFSDEPLFLHCRSAHQALLDVMDRRPASLTKVIIHCFTDGLAEADAYLKRGFYLGITRWVPMGPIATRSRTSAAWSAARSSSQSSLRCPSGSWPCIR
jgi:Tat protein secretion system quality control protein TatD with DNase activity